MTLAPRDPFSELVDERRRVNPEWYTWFTEIAGLSPRTVAELPSAALYGAGTRGFVTDANSTTFLSTVAGGGANKVPVVSDGTNWLIG